MPTKNRNISHLIENQLPGFIADQYEDFSIFIEKYYQQLELTGQPLDIISNITKYRDINYYEKNLLQQKTQLNGNVLSSDTTITVDDATSFPERGGYIRINDEICFYKERTDTEFLEVSRGVSGNNSLGDLYNSSEFVTTLAAEHSNDAYVYNISNLFLYAFVKSFESQYLASFPEKYLKDDVDKRILIQNITDFYRAKGTEKSIQFLFNTIVAKDPNDVPTVLNPKDFTLKASTSDWITKYVLKIKLLLGDPEKLIGNFITQSSNDNFSSAVVDTVTSVGEGFYEITLNPGSINGSFTVASRTKLRNDITSSTVENSRIDVFSTQGWNTDSILVDNEIIKFSDKNVNQFIVEKRGNQNSTHAEGTEVYSTDYISGVYDGQEVRFLTLGVLYNLNPEIAEPYSSVGDTIDINYNGVVSNHPTGESDRWFLNTDFRKAFSLLNPAASAVIGDLNADVSAIYEDDQYFYICSSGYPYHSILEGTSSTDLKDKKNLKLIRKFPTGIVEIYPTSNNDVGILADGSLLYSYKDRDEVIYGNIEEYNVVQKGNGYKVPPFVLVNNEPYKAKAFLNGETVFSIETIEDDVYTSNPDITITSGRGAQLKGIVTSGEITSIEVTNGGEYYSSAPTIQIIDLSGRGNFAEYRANVNALGELVSCTKINGGRLYTRENLLITVIPEGSGASATASVRKWVKDRYNVNFADLDDNYGTVIDNGYGVIANPRQLRLRLSDNINSGLQENPGTKVHSPIIGFAYDGFPIYGPYGYSDPGDADSVVSRIGSSYQLKGARPDGPSTTTYPLGTFIDDYEWIPSINTGKTLLDTNNGRFCVTPEYPEGVYAYFVTIDAIGTPVFPYSVGLNFYGLPVESNYTTSISQDDLPSNVKRLYQSDFFENGRNSIVKINEVKSGVVNSATVKGDQNTFSPNSAVAINNGGTSGSLLDAVVGEVNGKGVIDLESEQSKAVILSTKESAYFFENSTIFQGTGGVLSQVLTGTVIINEPTFSDSPDVRVAGDLQVNPAIDYSVIQTLETDLVQGVVIGDVEDDNKVVVRAVNGTFSKDLPISATIEAVSLTLDASASYTQGAILTYREKTTKDVLATGEVLNETNLQNSVRVKVLTGEFFISGDYEIKSSVFGDTSSRDIVTISQLSAGLTVTDINDSIAILRTDEDHQVLPGDFVTVDIRPDDAVTETNYQVRKRKFQKIVLQDQKYDDFIDDSGIGRGEILTTGSDYLSGEYTDVEIIFQDQTKTRENIGALGDINNARATITVSEAGGGYGGIVDVLITDKGENYKIGDVLTIDPDAIDRLPGSTATQLFSFVVVHAGFGFQNTVLRVRNTVNNICEGDFIQIGEEILLVNDSDVPNNILFVTRGQKGTKAIDHYDGQPISLESYEYRFALDTRVFEANLNSPKIISYDQETREMLIGWLYDYPNEPEIVISSILSDRSNPSKYIDVESVEEPKFVLEFIDSTGNFFVNPVIDIQKLYKYTFDTSHPSMADTFLDFSPSINLNLFTAEKVVNPILPGTPGASVSLKIGFGPAITDNDLSTVIDPRFGNYYYFIQAGDDVDTSESFLRIIEDPLVGKKQVIFTTPEEIVYNVDEVPQYDGSGTITYTTSAKNAIGSVAKISILNSGTGYLQIPSSLGILPTESYKAVVDATINAKGEIIEVDVKEPGKNYSKPVAIISDATGQKAFLKAITTQDGSITVSILNKGFGYTNPSVEIYESDVSVFFVSNNIGIPSSVTVESTGRSYSSDKTTLPQFKSNTTLVIDADATTSFEKGEIVKQGSVTAKVERYALNTNLLKLSDISGPIEVNQPIVGKKSSANVITQYVSIFDSVINSYYDNIGNFVSEKGILNSSLTRIADNFYYQDYSYSIRSRTGIEVWRDLILETLHPAGFKLFGEVIIESDGEASMVEKPKSIESLSQFQLKAEINSSFNTHRQITSHLDLHSTTLVRRGVGQVEVNNLVSGEIRSFDITLQGQEFDGDFDATGQLVGNTTFTLYGENNAPFFAYSDESLIVTLDGILQEPGVAYTVSGTTIEFNEPPFGPRIEEGVEVPGVSFLAKHIEFKDSSLSDQYIRKFKDISELFDGVETTFDLLELDDSIVKTDPDENLFVVLDGILQTTNYNVNTSNSYYIERSSDPSQTDRIVFSEPPINHGQRYEGAEEADIRQYSKCYITSIAEYKQLTINEKLVTVDQDGPYTIVDDGGNSIIIDSQRYALVFVDGVLQNPQKSYEIIGNQITFKEKLSYYSDEYGNFVVPEINILYFYGRGFGAALTVYDFEHTTYFAKSYVRLNGTFNLDNIGEIGSILYQNGIPLMTITGAERTGPNDALIVGMASAYFEVDDSDFSIKSPISSSFSTITGSFTATVAFSQDEDGFRRLVRWAPTNRRQMQNDDIYYDRRRLIDQILPNDLIKIDGESEFRRVLNVPRVLNTKQYNVGESVYLDNFGQLTASNYNGRLRGSDLAVVAEIDEVTGTITNLKWNKKDLQELADTGITGTGANDYVREPILQFIPVTPFGGGAKAKVHLFEGRVVSVELIDGGFGYEVPPTIRVSRGYLVQRNPQRYHQSISKLNLELQDVQFNLVISSEIELEPGPASEQAIFSVLLIGPTFNAQLQDLQVNIEPFDVSTTITQSNVEVKVEPSVAPSISTISNVEKEIVIFSAGAVGAETVVTLENIAAEVEYQIQYTITNKGVTSGNHNSTRGTFLDSNLSTTDTIAYVPNTEGFAEAGRLLINRELLSYDRKDSDKFFIDERGVNGTNVQDHQAGDIVIEVPDLVNVVSVAAVNIVSEAITSLENVSVSQITTSVATSASEVNTVSVVDGTSEAFSELQLIESADVVTVLSVAATNIILETSASLQNVSVSELTNFIATSASEITSVSLIESLVEASSQFQLTLSPELSRVLKELVKQIPVGPTEYDLDINIISSVSEVNVGVETPVETIYSVSMISSMDVGTSDEVTTFIEVSTDATLPEASRGSELNVFAESSAAFGDLSSDYELLVGLNLLEQNTISSINTFRQIESPLQVISTVNINISETTGAEVSLAVESVSPAYGAIETSREITVSPQLESSSAIRTIDSTRVVSSTLQLVESVLLSVDFKQITVFVPSPEISQDILVVNQSTIDPIIEPVSLISSGGVGITDQREIFVGNQINIDVDVSAITERKQITVFLPTSAEQVEESNTFDVSYEGTSVQPIIQKDIDASIVTSVSLITSGLLKNDIETISSIGTRLNGEPANVFTNILLLEPPRLASISGSESTITSVIDGGLSREVEAISSIPVVEELVNASVVNKIISEGVVDYFDEPVVLGQSVDTRNSGLVVLASPYNQVDTRSGDSYEVRNLDEQFKSNDTFANRQYSIINVGFNKNTYQSLAFIASGNTDVETTIEDLSGDFSTLTIGDFDPENALSNITLANEVFSRNTVSINNTGTVLNGAITDLDTTINVVLDLDSVNYPTSGFLLLNKEIIFYNSRTQFAFTGVTRGAQNTIPAAHVDGDVIMYFEEG